MKFLYFSTMTAFACVLPLLLGVKPIFAQTSVLSISPPVVEILIAPNKKIVQAFTVKNQGESTQFTPSLHQVVPKGFDGSIVVDPKPLDPSRIPLVVRLANSDIAFDQPFELKSGDSQQLVLEIEGATADVPIDTYLALVITPSGNSTSTTASAGISSLILTTLLPTSTLPLNLEITNFDLPLIHDNSSPLTLNLQLKNNSPNMIRPQGKVTIISPRGNHNEELTLFPHLILGENSRKMAQQAGDPPLPKPLVWQPSWYNIGLYRLQVTITSMGGNTLLESERTVWVLPLKLIGIILASGIFLVALYLRKNKHKLIRDNP